MIVRVFPRPGAPSLVVAETRLIALRHPGEHQLVMVVGERRVNFGDRVDVCSELVAELEDLDLTVEVAA